jgi:hypothetical protein
VARYGENRHSGLYYFDRESVFLVPFHASTGAWMAHAVRLNIKHSSGFCLQSLAHGCLDGRQVFGNLRAD